MVGMRGALRGLGLGEGVVTGLQSLQTPSLYSVQTGDQYWVNTAGGFNCLIPGDAASGRPFNTPYNNVCKNAVVYYALKDSLGNQ